MLLRLLCQLTHSLLYLIMLASPLFVLLVPLLVVGFDLALHLLYVLVYFFYLPFEDLLVGLGFQQVAVLSP